MRLALVQLCSEKGDVAGNLARHAEEIAAAKERKVDAIVFPEMSITGYIDPERWPDAVLTVDGPEVAEFVAMTHGIVAVAGIVEANPTGKPFITQIAAVDGQIACAYRKRHIVDEETEWFTPGPSEPATFDVHGQRLGIAVCADIDNADVYRDCADAGAVAILHCSAPGLYGDQSTRDWQTDYDWWQSECLLKDAAHATANGIYVAASTAAGRTIDEDFPGGGYLYDPEGRCLKSTPDWHPQTLDVTISIDGH